MASLVRAAKSGDKKQTLIAMRDILAKTIQNCESGRDMAAVWRGFGRRAGSLCPAALRVAERSPREGLRGFPPPA